MKEDTSQPKQLFDLYEEYFFLSKSRKLGLVDDFYKSLNEGLKSHIHPKPNSVCCHHSYRKPFKMLDSCVDKLPTGKEKGVHYAIDMGGTNLRCVRVNLLGNGQSTAKFKKIKLSEMKVAPTPRKTPNGNKYSKVDLEVNILDKNVSSETMFNSIALFFNDFLKECGDITDSDTTHNKQPSSSPLKVALTFSFPTQQVEINSANLITWTKGIEAGRSTDDHIEGKDVGDLLNSAFKRNGIPAQCECIINDTVGTLLSAMYDLNINNHNASSDTFKANLPTAKKPRSKPLIGIVIGTGVNACYLEPNSSNFGYKGTIINTECGDFFSSKLPSTDCDFSIDWFSDNRGEQRLEKMISGTYLGEISRLLILNFLKNHTPKVFFDKDSLKTEHIAEIASKFNDYCSPTHQTDLMHIETYLKETFSSQFDHHSTRIIAKISQMVLVRAASLVSILLAALIKKVNESHSEVTIAIDGSVWTKIPIFQKYVRDSLSSIITDKNTLDSIHFYDSDDGSGRGAAILASTIYHTS